MANMNEIRDRISSIKDIMKITNAMYLISSAKVKKARANWESVQPYFDNMQSTIKHILNHTEEFAHPFFDNGKEKTEEQKRYGYVVFSGDKGMCGSFNHAIVKFAEEEIRKHKNSAVFAVGTAGRIHLQRTGANVDVEFLYTVQDPTPLKAKEIAETITDHFLKGRLDEVYVIFTALEKAKEVCRKVKLFPLERDDFLGDESPADRHRTARFEPNPQAVLDTLIPNYVRGFMYGVLTASYCAENNARMSAMDSATSSASEMIAQLTLDYNRARQTAITQEITEIVSGAKSQHKKNA